MGMSTNALLWGILEALICIANAAAAFKGWLAVFKLGNTLRRRLDFDETKITMKAAKRIVEMLDILMHYPMRAQGPHNAS